MSTLIFVTWVFAVLLTVAGARKIARPAAAGAALQLAKLPSDERLVRVFGVGEVGLGVAVLLRGGPVATALLAVVYAGFAVFAEHQRRQRAGCGCFSTSTTPATPLHVVLNLVVAAIAAAVTVGPDMSLVTTVADDPLPGLMLVVLLAVAANLCFLLLTVAPDLTAAMSLVQSEDDA